MRITRLTSVLLLAAALLVPALARAADAPSPTSWRISGQLSEACTFSVPCTCNFGEGPSPAHTCWALFSLDIRKGQYGNVRLSGLRLAGAAGAKGMVAYIDQRATPEQAQALQAIVAHVGQRFQQLLKIQDPKPLDDPSTRFLGFKTVAIRQEVGARGNKLAIGDQGGFESDYILGIDGKTSVVVENNGSWNIQHGIKGKTKRLHYKDEFGNEFDLNGTNANHGQFDWSDRTPVYFR